MRLFTLADAQVDVTVAVKLVPCSTLTRLAPPCHFWPAVSSGEKKALAELGRSLCIGEKNSGESPLPLFASGEKNSVDSFASQPPEREGLAHLLLEASVYV
jgi:hypothetical protein